MAGLVWYMQLRGLDKQIRAMEGESAQKETFVTEGQALSDRLEEISKFTQGNVVWLDELARLSDTDKFPGADKAIANRVLMTSRTEGGGRISLELHISEQASKDLGSMVAKLKDSKHRVQDTGLKGDKRNRDYPWLLNQTITVLSESQQQEAQAAQQSSRSPSSKPRRRSAGTR